MASFLARLLPDSLSELLTAGNEWSHPPSSPKGNQMIAQFLNCQVKVGGRFSWTTMSIQEV